METRLILKTHTECLRPALFSLILLKYTQPWTVSVSNNVIASVRNDLKEKGFSGEPEDREAAARFALSIAHKHLKLLRSNMTWEWRGHALAAILRRNGKGEQTEPPGFAELSIGERVLYLKYFLEADGALLAAFAREIELAGRATRNDLVARFETMLAGIFDAYEGLAVGFRERTALKNRRREAVKQTKGESLQRSTLMHKVLPHLQLLVDLGIVGQSEDREVFYSLASSDGAALHELAMIAEHLDRLEDDVVQGKLFAVVSRVYRLNASQIAVSENWDRLESCMREAYSILKDATTGMAHTSALADWCCSVLLSEHRQLVSPPDVMNALNKLYIDQPSAIRFHVDFDGQPAYVIFSEGDR